MTSRRRMMMASKLRFEPDPEIPAAWKAVETISDSWSEIIYHAQKKGDYKTRYKLGDTKVANFGDEGLALMRLVGFDCDELTDGGYCKMAWLSENCLRTSQQWDSSENNETGYAASELKGHIDSLLTEMPKSLQSNIVQVKKSCRLYGLADQSVNVKIWIPSMREYYGETPRWSEDVGPIYTNPPRPAKGAGPNGIAGPAWLRSAIYGGSGIAIYLNADGDAYNAYYSSSYGVLPGFCI